MTTMIKQVNITLIASVIAATIFIPQAIAGDRNGNDRGGRDGQQHERRGDHHDRQGGNRDRMRGIKMFNRLDMNGDSVLSLDEMTTPINAKVEKIFAYKDSDQDGLLSLAEFQKNRRGEHFDLSGIADEIVQCVTDLKAETGNENIVVPDAEQFLPVADKFAAIDTSVDGFVDLAELQAAKMAKVTNVFGNMDSDEDGMVSKDEFKAQLKSHFVTKRAIHQCINDLIDEEEG